MAMGSFYRTKKRMQPSRRYPILRRAGKARLYRRVYAGQTHRFKQSVTKTGLANLGAGVPSGMGIKFQLSDCDQSATFASLFDQYRIDKVVIKLLPRATIVSTLGSAMAQAPSYFLVAVDHDDANTPATEAELRQYDNCKIVPATSSIKSFTVKPKIATAAFGGGVFTSYLNSKASWIDIASTGVEHYGFKIILPPSSTASSFAFEIMCDYYLSFKNAR